MRGSVIAKRTFQLPREPLEAPIKFTPIIEERPRGHQFAGVIKT